MTVSSDRRDGIQVDIVQLQLLQARLQRVGDVGDVGDDLGRDEELLSGHAGLLQRRPQLRLRLVDFGAVLVVVAQLERGQGGVDASLVEFRFIAGFVPGGTGAIADLSIVNAVALLRYGSVDLPSVSSCHR